MFATQLLRVLEAVPSTVQHETCVFHQFEHNMIMKENLHGGLHHTRSIEKKADTMPFSNGEIYQLNGCGRGKNPFLDESDDGNGFWNSKLLDDQIDNNENRFRDSPRKEDHSRQLHYLDIAGRRDSLDSLVSNNNPVGTGLESYMFGDYLTNGHRNCSGSDSPRASSNLLGTDTNLFTDKNVMEYKLPESGVPCRQISYHVVKDICVDEGIPAEDKVSSQNGNNDDLGLLVSKSCHNDQENETTKRAINVAESPSELTKDSADNEWGTNEDTNCNSFVQVQSNPTSEDFPEKDIAKVCDPKALIEMGEEEKYGATGKVKDDVCNEESFIDNRLPIQQFGTRSFLRSFLNSLENEGNEVSQPPEQNHCKGVLSGSSAALSSEAKDLLVGNFSYNSNVESGTVTFNFNSNKPSSTNNVDEESDHSSNIQVEYMSCEDSSVTSFDEDLLEHKNDKYANLSSEGQLQFDTSHDIVQCTIRADGSTKNLHEELEHKDSTDGDPSSEGELRFDSSQDKAQCTISDDRSTEDLHEESSDHKDGTYGHLSSECELHLDNSHDICSENCQVQCTSSKDTSMENVHDHCSDSGDGSSGNRSSAGQTEFDNDHDKCSENSEDQCTSSKDGSMKDVIEQSSRSKDGTSGDLSSEGQCQCHNDHDKDSGYSEVLCTSSEDRSIKDVHKQFAGSKAGTSGDLSCEGQLQFGDSHYKGSHNIHDKADEGKHILNHESSNSGSVSTPSQVQRDEGESSFSGAGLITYSGPIAYSGSLSLRSDSSATSTRSFAFPVLQSEWNSSPVRMAKADKKQFRKHRGWRSGLLCCGF